MSYCDMAFVLEITFCQGCYVRTYVPYSFSTPTTLKVTAWVPSPHPLPHNKMSRLLCNDHLDAVVKPSRLTLSKPSLKQLNAEKYERNLTTHLCALEASNPTLTHLRTSDAASLTAIVALVTVQPILRLKSLLPRLFTAQSFQMCRLQ